MNCKVCNKDFSSFFELTTHLVKDHNYKANDLYKYYEYSFETRKATCPICGKEFTMEKRQIKKYKDGTGRGITCGRSCSSAFMNLVYGNPSCRPEVKEKKRQRALEKYGVENVSQAKDVKEKIKRTNLKKYGVEYVMQSSEILRKSKETNLEKYGVEHVSQRKDIKDRKREKSLDKYGVDNISQAGEIKEKKKQSALEKYGVEFTLQDPEVREKGKKTMLKRYGVEVPAQSKEIQGKTRNTNLEKYGVEYATQAEEVKEKIKKTNIQRYGVPYTTMSEDVKDKSKKTNLEKYGVEYFCQHEKCYGANHSRISNINKKFHNLLQNNGVESFLEFIIDSYGYDLKVGNTLVEIDPFFTHNVTTGPCFGGKERETINEYYHSVKTSIAREHGYNCIHVFDWDDWNKVIDLLRNRGKIPARKCTTKELFKKETDKFLNEYHLQGSTRQFTKAYGLFYEGELVEVMTFGKPRYNKNYEYELLRLCSNSKYSVVGGASKLLKYFEEEVNPESLISYCDLSKFDGSVYEKLGFTLKEQTAPAKHWYNPKTKRHITDNLLRQRGYDQLHKANFGKGTSNEQLMREHDYVEIFDCGQLVFVKEMS